MFPGLGLYCIDPAQPLTTAGEELDDLDLSDLSDLEHDLSDLSDLDHNLSDLSDLDHDLSGLSVRRVNPVTTATIIPH